MAQKHDVVVGSSLCICVGGFEIYVFGFFCIGKTHLQRFLPAAADIKALAQMITATINSGRRVRLFFTFKMSIRCYFTPEWPNPPSPRSLSSRLSVAYQHMRS